VYEQQAAVGHEQTLRPGADWQDRGVPDVSFPVLQARTARFTLGRPRNFVVSPDGSRVAFLRSRGGTDRVTCLWVYDVATGTERLIADPHVLLAAADDPAAGELPASERARRERAREQAGGIVGYATDAAVSMAAFALAGRLFVADLVAGSAREVDVQGPVFDPRPDPTGRRVAFARSGSLRLVDVGDGGGADVELVTEDGVSWGVAEFVAAEEMNRQRGYWWAPDGTSLLACRVDESAVPRWYIGDPAQPDRTPTVVAYPAAGTTNADVSLWRINLDGARLEVMWDVDDFPYLVDVRWRKDQPPLLQVASRDQRTMQLLDVDVVDGVTTLVRQDRDPHWLEVVHGVPDRLADGRLVWTVDVDDTRRLVVGDHIATPLGVQVRAVLASGPDGILFNASSEPTEQHLWWFSPYDDSCVPLTAEPGVHTGTAAGGVLVVSSTALSDDGVRTAVRRDGVEVGHIASFAEPAPFTPCVSISRQGPRELRTALVLPQWHVAGSRKLPVLMDPYGGPHAQRVTASRSAYLNAQWLADQGFAVVIADGRGTPGRGAAWERAIAGDLATPVLEDQIDALQSLAAANPDLDTSRVAIRGWSFGGYLAALAVLRRPDVFHAAVAGAPVTDWRLYDTYYTERYLGVDASASAYDASSLIDDAPTLSRPLLIVHGLADDNVVAAHSLRLSSALLAAGRPHNVLPLSGVTHMTPQETVAANLLSLEVAFLRSSLAVS
jgi:dipeptidyl-peptidase 4